MHRSSRPSAADARPRRPEVRCTAATPPPCASRLERVNVLPFVAVAVLIILTPGPDMALMTRNALAGGRRAALFTGLGITVGLLIWTAASVIGLVAVLAASAVAFTVVKLAGAVYLVYLGVRTLLSLRDRADDEDAVSSRTRAQGSPFRQGLLTNLLNPKIAVLFTSLIPQFVEAGPSATMQSLVLAAIFVSLGLVWLVTYALLATAFADALRRPTFRRAMSAITGVVLIGLGVRLATESR